MKTRLTTKDVLDELKIIDEATFIDYFEQGFLRAYDPDPRKKEWIIGSDGFYTTFLTREDQQKECEAIRATLQLPASTTMKELFKALREDITSDPLSRRDVKDRLSRLIWHSEDVEVFKREREHETRPVKEMEEFIYPDKAMKRCGINIPTLLQYVSQDLPAYDFQNPAVRLQLVQEGGKAYFKTESPPAYYPLHHETGGFSNWIKAHPPDPNRPHYTAYYTIQNNLCVFKLSELEAFGKEHGLPSLLAQAASGPGANRLQGAEMEKDIWLTSKELMERWQINKYSLAQYVWDFLSELHFTTISGKWLDKLWAELAEKAKNGPIAWGNVFRNAVGGFERGLDYNGTADDEYYAGLKYVITIADILQNLDDMIFWVKDVIEFEIKHGLATTTEEPINNLHERAASKEEPEREGNYFIRCGEYWQVGFKGEKAMIRDAENIRYILQLVMNQGKEVHVFDLTRSVKGRVPEVAADQYANMADEELEQEGMSKSTLSGGRSERDRADYKKAQELLADLEKTKQRGIPMEIEEAQKEYDEKVAAILKGTNKKMNPEEEKARVNVKNHIDRAIKKLEKAGLKKLASHLADRLDKGVKCIYKSDPANPVDWQITP